MAKSNNHKLKKQILGLEQEEFDKLFLTNHAMLYHYGKSFSSDEQLVEDCIQELFIHLYEKEIKLSSIQNLKAYLFTALRRRILDKKQKNLRIPTASINPEIHFSVEDLSINQEDKGQRRQLLATHLNNLPWRQKEAVYLKFFNNLSAKEIAEIMGITSQVVSNTVYKAIKKLKEISLKSILVPLVNSIQLFLF